MSGPSLARGRAVPAGCLLALCAAIAGAQVASIGLSSVRAQVFFNEEMNGFPVESGDLFAWSFAAGDFNGDGAQDLATGIPYDDGPSGQSISAAGAVIVRWGSPGGGLSTTPAPTHLSMFAAGSQAPSSCLFGAALAAGDFDGDGRDDLAVGLPVRFTGNAGNPERGAVQIHYGEPDGIQLAGAHFLHTGLGGNIPDPPESDPLTEDRLGSSLAAGDFDGDGFDDLAIGAIQHNDDGDPQAGGAVVVLHGGSGGLMPVAGYLVQQDVPTLPDQAEEEDDFGYALAAGNFNGDTRCNIDGLCRPIDDLAMSAPGEDGAGKVLAILGSDLGLDFGNSIYFGQAQLGSPDEPGDRFGTSLASGNFNGDCCDDLAIGTPLEGLGPNNETPGAGEVTILFGLPDVFFVGAQFLTQGSIFGDAAYDQIGDQFGFALAAGDFDGDGADDLAVGQPGERLGGMSRGGATILAGGPGGPGERFRFLGAGINGIPPDMQDSSEMGRALAAGDFDGNGYADLAIGLPRWDEGGLADTGAETILYGAMFADGFESGNDWHWSDPTP